MSEKTEKDKREICYFCELPIDYPLTMREAIQNNTGSLDHHPECLAIQLKKLKVI